MVCGLMHTRNDAWCIGYTARVACQWVDKLLVYAHACTDKTVDILKQVKREYQGKVCIFIDPDPEWREMDHRQYMLEWARQLKATHIAIIDSDEALTANLLPRQSIIGSDGGILDLMRQTPRGKILSLPGIQVWSGPNHYRTDGRFTAKFSLGFVDDPLYSWRPRFVYGTKNYQHHSRPPQPLTEGFCPEVDGGILHFQFARLRALRFKQMLYEMREAVLWPEQSNEQIARKYSWWTIGAKWPLTGWMPAIWYCQDFHRHLDFSDDNPTWYEEEVLKMIAQHGKVKFTGLNDFGLGVLS